MQMEDGSLSGEEQKLFAAIEGQYHSTSATEPGGADSGPTNAQLESLQASNAEILEIDKDLESVAEKENAAGDKVGLGERLKHVAQNVGNLVVGCKRAIKFGALAGFAGSVLFVGGYEIGHHSDNMDDLARSEAATVKAATDVRILKANNICGKELRAYALDLQATTNGASIEPFALLQGAALADAHHIPCRPASPENNDYQSFNVSVGGSSVVVATVTPLDFSEEVLCVSSEFSQPYRDGLKQEVTALNDRHDYDAASAVSTLLQDTASC